MLVLVVERIAESVVARLAVEASIAAIACADDHESCTPQMVHVAWFGRQVSRMPHVVLRVRDNIARICAFAVAAQCRARPWIRVAVKQMLSEIAQRCHATQTAAVAWRPVRRL